MKLRAKKSIKKGANIIFTNKSLFTWVQLFFFICVSCFVVMRCVRSELRNQPRPLRNTPTHPVVGKQWDGEARLYTVTDGWARGEEGDLRRTPASSKRENEEGWGKRNVWQSDYYRKEVDRPVRIADKWYKGEQNKFEGGRVGRISGTWLGMIPGSPLDRSEYGSSLWTVRGDVIGECLLFACHSIRILKAYTHRVGGAEPGAHLLF